jgi:hypothetical protein
VEAQEIQALAQLEILCTPLLAMLVYMEVVDLVELLEIHLPYQVRQERKAL